MPTFIIVVLSISGFVGFLLLIGFIARATRLKLIPGPPLTTDEEGHYFVANKAVVCLHCRGKTFSEHEALLNTWFLSLITLDWLDPTVTALACDKCGHITWFAQTQSSKQSKN